jgi:O-antigen ligase
MQEYVGVTTTKNMLGMMALIFGVGFVWRLLAALRDREDIYRKRRLIAYGTLLAMALWLLSMAHSTTSLTCFLMGSALLVVTGMRMPPRKATIIHLLVATMIAVAFFALFIDAGGGLVESLGKDPTLTGRTAIWDLVLRLTGNPVIGTGYESFWLGERLQKIWDVYRGIQEAHNGYLEVFLNLGWIGITLLTGILVTGYRNAIVTYQRNPESGSIRLAYFVIAVVYSFTEAGFRMQFPVWICFLLATIRLPEVTPSDGRVAARMTPAGIFEEQEQVLTAFS